jgi:hypothetical protein
VKALSIWQPWASLIAIGAKTIETRHWEPSFALIGQRIAIHASKTDRELRLCSYEPFDRFVPNAGLLPLGAVIATARLHMVVPITAQNVRGLRETPELTAQEAAFGDYTPGRFGWMLADVQRLDRPLRWRGAQGVFEIPDDVIRMGSTS